MRLLCTRGLTLLFPLTSTAQSRILRHVIHCCIRNCHCCILCARDLMLYLLSYSSTHTHIHTHTHQDSQVPPPVVWCTPGGGRPHVPALLEHSYCMLEGQLEVGTIRKVVEQTTSVYQSSQSTLRSLPILLELEVVEHICMVLSIKLEDQIMGLFTQSINIMSHVQSAILQHEKLL